MAIGMGNMERTRSFLEGGVEGFVNGVSDGEWGDHQAVMEHAVGLRSSAVVVQDMMGGWMSRHDVRNVCKADGWWVMFDEGRWAAVGAMVACRVVDGWCHYRMDVAANGLERVYLYCAKN